MRLRSLLAAAAVCVAMAVYPAVDRPASADDVVVQASDGDEVASAQARESGHPVEVDALTTQTRKVTAQPDGSFVMETSALPVRVKRGGLWLDVDLTLQRNLDGTIGPKVAASSMAFSGGGNTNLARLGVEGRRLNIDWQVGPLPTPTLAQDRAIFAEVLPGVDLVVQAQAEGFKHFLVVKTSQAAANPALRAIRYGLRGEGVSVVERPGEGLDAVDAAGQVVFSAPQPIMWDSPATSTQTAGGAGVRSLSVAASDPVDPELLDGASGDSAKADLAVEVSGGALTLQPDAAMLANPQTRFPVVIDPYWSGRKEGETPISGDADNSGWLNIFTNGFNEWKPSWLEIGSWDSPNSQAFIRMDTDGLWRGHTRPVVVQDVDLTFDVKWAASCGYGVVHLHASTGFNSGTDWDRAYDPAYPNEGKYWNVPGGTSSLLGSVNVGNKGLKECGNLDAANDVIYSGTPSSNLGKLMQYAADKHSDYVNLRLRPEKQEDIGNWKEYGPYPRLKVTYTHPPDVPTALKMTSPTASCTATAGVVWIGDDTPTLTATTADVDAGDLLTATFEVTKHDGTAVWSGTTAAAKPGVVNMAVPAGKLTDTANGTQYRWRVRATQAGITPTAWTGWCEFTLDKVAPTIAPSISSADFPTDRVTGWDPVSGWKPGSFALDAAGTADVVKYGYAVNGGSEAFLTTTAGAPATLAFTPTRMGRQWVTVRVMDRAGNPGPSQTYYFKVAGSAPRRDLAVQRDQRQHGGRQPPRHHQ